MEETSPTNNGFAYAEAKTESCDWPRPKDFDAVARDTVFAPQSCSIPSAVHVNIKGIGSEDVGVGPRTNIASRLTVEDPSVTTECIGVGKRQLTTL
jgi:hypothetical protein